MTLEITQEALQQIITSAVAAATAAQLPTQRVNPAEKPKRPTISSCTTQEKWSYFLTKWERYKTMTGITGDQLRSQLIQCCDEELQFDLHRSTGAQLVNKTECEILAEIKKYAG